MNIKRFKTKLEYRLYVNMGHSLSAAVYWLVYSLQWPFICDQGCERGR